MYRVACIQQFPIVLPDTPHLADEFAEIAGVAKQLMAAGLNARQQGILRARMDEAVRGIYRQARRAE